MSDRISRPVFNGTPLDDLSVVDVYDDTVGAVTNNFKSEYSAFSKSLSDTIGKQTSDLGSLFTELRSGDVGLKTGLDRVRETISGARTNINNLSNEFKSRIDAIMDVDIPPQYFKEMKTNVMGIYKTIRNADLDNIKGITGMLGELTGNDLFDALDIGAEVALITATLEEIDSWEIPEFIDEVMEFFGKNKSPEAASIAVTRSSNYLSLYGDIDTIDTILKHVDPSTLTREVPDFVERLLSRYLLKFNETAEHYPMRLEQLLRILNLLQPNWLHTERRGQQVFNLAVLQAASPDAVLLLSFDEDIRIAVLTAPNYPRREGVSIMREMYPYIPLPA